MPDLLQTDGRVSARRLTGAIAILTLLATLAGAAPVGSPSGVAVNRPAPDFTLADDTGRQRTLSEFRGRPVALYFFCGCSWCGDVGREWAQMQRAGVLPQAGPNSKPPVTLVVYNGFPPEVTRAFSRTYGFDPKQTVSLADPAEKVSGQTYRASLCPRVFVLDAAGVLRYTNNGRDDAPRKAPALAIVSKALDALRAAAPPRRK